AAPFAWSPQLTLGFLNYVAALPLMLWLLARAARLADGHLRSRRALAVTAALALLLFYTHLIAFLFALCGAGLFALRGGSERPGSLGERLRAAPAVAGPMAAAFA